MGMSPRLLRPRATGFNPKSITGLSFWLDAADSSTVTTVSDAVSEWRSKAGNSLTATQSTAANRPAYTTNGRNGKNVVTFDGVESNASGDWLVTSTLSINQPFTIFWAGRSNGRALAEAFDGPYVCDGSTSSPRVAIAHRLTDTNGRLGMFAGTAIQSTGTAAYNEWAVISAVFNGLSSSLIVNGSLAALVDNVGDGNIAALRLGSRFDGASTVPSSFFEGPWGEFLIYNRVLTTAQRLSVERYLGSRWEVTVA